MIVGGNTTAGSMLRVRVFFCHSSQFVEAVDESSLYEGLSRIFGYLH